MRSFLHGLLGGCAIAALSIAFADDDQPDTWPQQQPLNTYGVTGLLEMPSARVMPDGEMGVTVATAPKAFRTSLSFQVFPWLEAGFRYSQLSNYFENVPIAPGTTRGTNNLYDRSFSLKIRLSDEGKYIPAIAVGFNDIIGTGIYGGEYLVASKAVGDFDVTLGLGWGRLGSTGMFKNPFGLIDSRFYNRPGFNPNASQGGLPLFGSVFRGPDVSLFGGVVWQTPIEGLQAVVEYSSDAYKDEQSKGIFTPSSQVNYGLVYKVDDLIDASASYLYGNTFSVRLSFRFDPTVETMKVLEPPPPPPNLRPADQRPKVVNTADAGGAPGFDLSGLRGVRLAEAADEWSLEGYHQTAEAKLDKADPAKPQPSKGSLQEIMVSGQWYDIEPIRKQIINGVRDLADIQNLNLQYIELKPHYVVVYYENNHYTRDTDEIHRLLRVLTTLPPSVEYFYIVSVTNGFPSTQITVNRSDYERAVGQFTAVDNLLEYVDIKPADMEIPDDAIPLGDSYPRYDWSIEPALNLSYFDPNDPIRVGLDAEAAGSVEFTNGWKVEVGVSTAIIKAIGTIRPNTSQLPHVRTDFQLYESEGATGLEDLMVTKTGKLSPDIWYQAKAGYLEDMFAGFGGEVVWRPPHSDISWGANLYYLKQRDFNRQFGLQDYGVVTGQVSMYWQNAVWKGINVNVHVGRYLAGDYGGTVEVTRQFDSGIELGAFATITNVPAAEFGEGSFDKGLIIRIPLGWIAPFNTNYTASTYLRSLTRDGGQRLYDRNPLWESLRDDSETQLRNTWPLDVTPGL